MPASRAMPMAGASELQWAKTLHQAGRLHELIGVSPGASQKVIKAACRAAQLKSHPDKPGGDTELFKLVDDAAQLLVNDLPSFDSTQAVHLRAKIESRRCEIGPLEALLVELRATITQATTDYQKATAQKSLATTGIFLECDARELRSLREEYVVLHRKHVQEQAENEARAQQMMEEARQKMIRHSRERDALRKRCSRKQSTRFPTMPRMSVGAARQKYVEIRNKFRKLSKARSRYAHKDMDAASFDSQLQALLDQARALVDSATAAKCEARGVHTTFPRVACTHPKYECLAELRKAHRRLCDRMRKSRGKQDLEAQDVEILHQAWSIVGGCEVARMSTEVDAMDTKVR